MGGAVLVRLFATAREAAGTDWIRHDTGPGGIALRDLLKELGDGRPALARILRHARFARNGTYIRGPGTRLRAGDELAVHPPYSGG
jgi:molybdopterin converting factor small subunit